MSYGVTSSKSNNLFWIHIEYIRVGDVTVWKFIFTIIDLNYNGYISIIMVLLSTGNVQKYWNINHFTKFVFKTNKQ